MIYLHGIYIEKNIITSQSVTREYTTVDSEGKTVTRSKIITATHSESTPFFYKGRHFLIKTRFAPELELMYSLNSKEKIFDLKSIDFSKKTTKLENKEFNKNFPIHHNPGAETSFFTFFSSFNQEIYLAWLNTESKNVPSYVQKKNVDCYAKFSEFLVFQPRNDINFDYHNKNSFLDTININSKTTVPEVVKNIFDTLRACVYQSLEAITWLFLNSNINREDYNGSLNNQYLINNNIQINYSKNKNLYKNSYLDVYSEIRAFNPFWMMNYSCDKEPWVENGIIHKYSNNLVNRCDLEFHSYNAKKEIDHVTVSDFDCGVVVIPVPYVRYYPFFENKTIIYNSKHLITNFIFTANATCKRKVYASQFKDETLYERTLNNNIWFYLENEKINEIAIKKMNDIVERFWKIVDHQTKLFSFISNQNGTYVTINDTSKCTDDLVRRIQDFLIKL